MRRAYIEVDDLIDILECVQNANDNKIINDTIDLVIDVVYDLAEYEE